MPGRRSAAEQQLCRSTVRPVLYVAADSAVRALKTTQGSGFGARLFAFETPGRVRSLCFDGPEDFLIVGTACEIEIVIGNSGRPLNRYPCPVVAMCFSEAERKLFTSSKDDANTSVLRSWHLDAGGRLLELDRRVDMCNDLGDYYIHSLAFDPWARRLFAGRNNGTVKTWQVGVDGNFRGVLVEFRAHEGRVCDVMYSQGNSLLFTQSSNARLRVWYVPSHSDVKPAGPLCEVCPSVSNFAYDPEHRLLFTSGNSGPILVWRLDHDRVDDEILWEVWRTSEVTDALAIRIAGLACDVGARALFVWGRDDRLYTMPILTDGSVGDVSVGLYTMEEEVRQATCSTYDPERRLLFAGFADGVASVWQVGRWGEVITRGSFDAHGSSMSCVCFDSRLGLLITAGDMTVAVWRTEDDGASFVEVEQASASQQRNAVTSSFSLSQRSLETGPQYLRRRRSRRSTAGLRSIVCMAYDPGQHLLVTGEELAGDGTLRLWSVDAAGALTSVSDGHVQAPNGGFQAMRLVNDPKFGLLLLTGAGGRELASWWVSAAFIRPLFTRPQAHAAKEKHFCLEYDASLRLCFTAGFDGVVRIWRVQEDGSFMEVTRFEVAAVPYGEAAAPVAERQTRFRYLPAHRLLVTHGCGPSLPRLWSISKDGSNGRELWFPSHMYRGETSLISSAPGHGPGDPHSLLWCRTRNGRWAAVSLSALFQYSLVCTLGIDCNVLAAFMSWWVPGPMFLGQLLVLAVNFLQLVWLGMGAMRLPMMQHNSGYLRKFVLFTAAEWPERIEFAVGASLAIAAISMLFALDWINDRCLMDIGCTWPGVVRAIMQGLATLISGVGLLPWLVALLSPMRCVWRDGRAVVEADRTVPCWSRAHLDEFITPGALCVAVVVYFGARLSRLKGDLLAVKFRRNPLDWSGDSLLPEDLVVRRSPLELKDSLYDYRACVIKFVGLLAQSIAHMADFHAFSETAEGLQRRRDWQQVVMSAIVCLCGALLVRTAFVTDRFFDPGCRRSLMLPLGLEQNALLAALVAGVFWSYLMQLVSSIAVLGKDPREVLQGDAIPSSLSAGTVVVMCVGYYLRARRRTTGTCWVARAPMAMRARLSTSEAFHNIRSLIVRPEDGTVRTRPSYKDINIEMAALTSVSVAPSDREASWHWWR